MGLILRVIYHILVVGNGEWWWEKEYRGFGEFLGNLLRFVGKIDKKG